jgi:hypothetical protein
MIDRDTLAGWSRVPDGADRYLRPFVCRGTMKRGEAAIVGLNPATAIRFADIPFEQYLDLLVNLDAFTTFYRELRVKRKKRATSPTRTGLNGMAKWLSVLGWQCIVDTNVSPYPTESKEDLEKVPAQWQSRWVFKEVVRTFAPRLIVLHGEDALDDFVSGVAPDLRSRARGPFSRLVDDSPRLGQITWAGGESCDVFVCRHLRFFGHHGGDRFSALGEALRFVQPRA